MKLVTMVIAFALPLVAAGCNTMNGIGADLAAGGRALSDAASSNSPSGGRPPAQQQQQQNSQNNQNMQR